MILQLKTETSPGVFIYKPLDVFEDFEVTYNHQFEDYSTLSGRKIPYSNKFKIPTTPNNRVLCGLPVDANYPVSRDVDGKMYYSNGLIAFDFICSIEGQQIDTLQPYIEISVIDIISNALKELGKWKMSDFFADANNTQRRYVDLTTDTWVYGSANLTNTSLDEMFTFPFYNFNNKNLMFAYDPMRKLSQIQPTFTLWKLIENIFSFAGISVESDFLKLDNQLYPGIKANELGLLIPMIPMTSDNYIWLEDCKFSGKNRTPAVIQTRLAGVPNQFPSSPFLRPDNFLTTSIPNESLKFNYDIASSKYDVTSPLDIADPWATLPTNYVSLMAEDNNATAGSFCSTVDGEAKITLTNLTNLTINNNPIHFYISQFNNAESPVDINGIPLETAKGNVLSPLRLATGVVIPDMDVRMVVSDEMESLTGFYFEQGWSNTGVSYNINESVICGNAVYEGMTPSHIDNHTDASRDFRNGLKFRIDFNASTEMLLKLEANKGINIAFILTPKNEGTVSIDAVWELSQDPYTPQEFNITTEITQGYIKHSFTGISNGALSDEEMVEAKYYWGVSPVNDPWGKAYNIPVSLAVDFTEATSMPTGFISGTTSAETVMNTAKIDMSESMKTVKDYKLIDIVKMVSQRFNLKFYSTADGVIHLDTNKNRLSGLSYNIDHLTDTGVSVEFTDNEIGIVNIKDTNPSFYEEDFNRLDNNIVSEVKREETTLTFNSSIINSKMFKDEYDESSFGLLATGLSSNHFGVADRKQASASDLKPAFTFLKEKVSELWFPINECSLSSYNYDPDFTDPQIDAAFYNSFRKGTFSTSLEAIGTHELGFDLVSFIDDKAPLGTRNLYMQTWFQNIMDRVNDESVILSPDIYVSEATLKNLMDFPTILYKGSEWEYQGLNNYPLSNKKGGMTNVKLIKKKVWAREGAPTMPLNHIVTLNENGNEITTSWDASTDDVLVTGYKLYLDGYLVFTNNVILSYTYTGLNLGQSYTMGVSAIDADGNESEINWLTETVKDATNPFDASSLYATQLDACGSIDTANVYYHNGINVFPVAGDGVAVNVGFTILPSNGYYRMPGASSVAFIEGGTVTSITTGC